MTWFYLALVAPFLYALTNHIDKVLLDKYFKEGGAGTLLIFSALLSVIVLPILFVIDPTVFQVSPLHILALACVGILNVLVLWCYLAALENEEASITVVFYQLVPVFGLILAYFILHETLSARQLIAMAIIIVGTAIVSFELDVENRFTMRMKTIVLMTMAAFFWGLESVIFKAVALDERVVRSLFWEHLMLFLMGVCIFVFIGKYRRHFLTALVQNSKGILLLNVVNESLYMGGNIIFSFAYMLAPVALVLLAESYQPIFTFAISIYLFIAIPELLSEQMHKKHLWQKGIAIFVTAVGTYILFMP